MSAGDRTVQLETLAVFEELDVSFSRYLRVLVVTVLKGPS